MIVLARRVLSGHPPLRGRRFTAGGTRLGGYGQLPVYTSRGFAATLPRMLARRTKIVATLGPATDPPGVLDRLVAAGMDCARLNCSHGTARGPAPPRRRGARGGGARRAAARAAVRPAGARSCACRRDRQRAVRPATRSSSRRPRARPMPDRRSTSTASRARHRALGDRHRRRRAALRGRARRGGDVSDARRLARPARRRARAST